MFSRPRHRHRREQNTSPASHYQQSMSNPQTPFDTPWKDAIERYFEDFIRFFFPQAHGEIEWRLGVRISRHRTATSGAGCRTRAAVGR
nr:hypothetical protein [Chroococcidiopsis sp. SAG 2025]